MSESVAEQIIYDRLIADLKAYVSKNDTLTINSIECKLSIDDYHAVNEHLTLTLTHEYIDKILIWPDTHINFEVMFNENISKFFDKNKLFTQELIDCGNSVFILNMTHNSTVDDVLNMINLIFTDNTKIESIMCEITEVNLF